MGFSVVSFLNQLKKKLATEPSSHFNFLGLFAKLNRAGRNQTCKASLAESLYFLFTSSWILTLALRHPMLCLLAF
jgi:hypothetical protein